MPVQESPSFLGVDMGKLTLAIQFPDTSCSRLRAARHVALCGYAPQRHPPSVLHPPCANSPSSSTASSKILTLRLFLQHRCWRLVSPFSHEVE